MLLITINARIQVAQGQSAKGVLPLNVPICLASKSISSSKTVHT